LRFRGNYMTKKKEKAEPGKKVELVGVDGGPCPCEKKIDAILYIVLRGGIDGLSSAELRALKEGK